MWRQRMKKLALGLSAAVAMSWSPAKADIQVWVDETFVNAASDLIGAFEAYYFNTYNLNYNVGLSFTLGGSFVSQFNPQANFVDLYIASTTENPAYLLRHYRPQVIGRPFVFGRDIVSLYSQSVNISAGLPFPLTTTFAIPDPTIDNFGQAAVQILGSRPWRIPPWKIPGGFVKTWQDVGTTQFAIQVGDFPYGFVAKSGICIAFQGTETFPAGSFHHDYEPYDLEHPYEQGLVTLTGVALAKTGGRTADQNAELQNFISFLLGTPNVQGATNTTGPAIVKSYCFKLIPPHPGDPDH
jgi:molybdate transport system substrate-binding protein